MDSGIKLPYFVIVYKILSTYHTQIFDAIDGTIEQHVGNYLFIGVVEVGLQIFAFVIVYKILSTYHTQIFEAIEVKAASSFDTAIDSAKQDAQGWGTKV